MDSRRATTGASHTVPSVVALAPAVHCRSSAEHSSGRVRRAHRVKGPTEPRRQRLLGSQDGLDKDDLCAGLVHVPGSQVGSRTPLCRPTSPTDLSDLCPHRPPFPSRLPSSAASVCWRKSLSWKTVTIAVQFVTVREC